MKNEFIKNIKLGFFVLTSLTLLIFLFYMIGKNKNFFGSNFKLRARFENIQGLKAGNNIRFAGIDVGTVDKIEIINDTLLEVIMTIDKKMLLIIRKNAIASIGTDGLVGNKVINISAVKQKSEFVKNNDMLYTKRSIDTDEMLKTLNKSNNDIAIITENLKSVSEKLNKGKALWNLINDSMLTIQIKSSINKIITSTNKINDLLDNTNSIVKDVKKGKGSIGLLLYDTILSKNIQNSAFNLEATSNKTSELSSSLKSLTENLKNDIEDGNGIIHLILKDSLVKKDLTESITYIKKDSKGINEIIDAIKKSFLFRRHFRNNDKN